MKSQKWRDIEEALGIVWHFKSRKDKKDGAKLKETLTTSVSPTVIKDLLEHKLIALDGDTISLTSEGEEIGRDITRRHRLAERLLADVIEVKGEEIDKTACEVEHIISADVADAICTLLGHPRVCPHGSPIPEGECCKKAGAHIESVVLPLSKLEVGKTGIIAYIVTSSHPYLHKLLSLGIVPGTEVRLHQSSPSFVIKAGETQIALDKEIAGQIYVRRT